MDYTTAGIAQLLDQAYMDRGSQVRSKEDERFRQMLLDRGYSTEEIDRMFAGDTVRPSNPPGGFKLKIGGGGPPEATLGSGYGTPGFDTPDFGGGYETPGPATSTMSALGYGSPDSANFNPLPGIGKFVSKNPEVVTSVLGTAADIFGSERDRSARQREGEEQRKLERERLDEERKRREDQRMLNLLQMIGQPPPRY